MSANQWFKFYGGEYLSDPKIERLNPIERSCWITLLCLASMQGSATIKHLTVQSLLNKSGVHYDPYQPEEWESALSILDRLESLEMIEKGDTGVISIVNWAKRQETAMTGAERVAKYRQNKKSNENVTESVTNVTLEENRIEENRIEENRREEKKGTVRVSAPKVATFTRPSIQEIESYVREEGIRFDSKKFFYYYESNGWKVGKNAMKSWKMAIKSWHSKDNKGENEDVKVINLKDYKINK